MGNRSAFLAMIGVSEGTSTCHGTKNNGYDVIVGGEIFTDYSDHPFARGRPPKVINSKLSSTGSGRYQIMLHDWPHYKAMLNLPDFSPASQDAYALQLLRERAALPLIDGGQFAVAVQRCNNLWASFTGAQYGQQTHSIDFLRDAYLAAGGTLYDGHVSQPIIPEWGNESRR
jgi:muramidase (phage lysozyme)